jgi:hypothetical protein
MRPIKIEELIPLPGEFTLRATGKTYRLEPVSVADRIWITKNFGNDLEDIFRSVRAKEIAQIAFHQMSPEDKEFFTEKSVEFIDDLGHKKEELIGGINLFLRLIRGNDEITAVLSALLHTIGISQPLLDEMAEDVAQESAQKKSEISTGERSLISSPVNMDGLLETSAS